MNMTAQVQVKPASTPSFTPVHTNLLQRKCACDGTPGPTGACVTCHTERRTQRRWDMEVVQRKAFERASMPISPAAFPKTGGVPLAKDVQGPLEQRFGAEFSNVRIHTDTPSGRSALELNARAFTRGQDIYFAPGHYQPATSTGLGLLAHELTHVVQQRNGQFPVTSSADRAAQARSRLEDEAEQVEQSVQSSTRLPRIQGKVTKNKIFCSPDPASWFKEQVTGGIETVADETMKRRRDSLSPLSLELYGQYQELRRGGNVMLPADAVAMLEDAYRRAQAVAPSWVPIPNLSFAGPPVQGAAVLAIPVAAVALLYATLFVLSAWLVAKAINEIIELVKAALRKATPESPTVPTSAPDTSTAPEYEPAPETSPHEEQAPSSGVRPKSLAPRQSTEPKRLPETGPTVGPVPEDQREKRRPNSMRFQVQWGSREGGPTFSQIAVDAPPYPGVTTVQAVAALNTTLALVEPRAAQVAATPAAARQKAWIMARPPAGIAQGGYSRSEYFPYRRFTDARVDVENQRGHNLKV